MWVVFFFNIYKFGSLNYSYVLQNREKDVIICYLPQESVTIAGTFTVSLFISPKELKEILLVFQCPVTSPCPSHFPEGATTLRLQTTGYLPQYVSLGYGHNKMVVKLWFAFVLAQCLLHDLCFHQLLEKALSLPDCF